MLRVRSVVNYCEVTCEVTRVVTCEVTCEVTRVFARYCEVPRAFLKLMVASLLTAVDVS